MTVSEIQGNINYNVGLLDQYYSEQRTLEKQIDELEQLRGKFTTLQNNFGSKQEKRQQGLAKFARTNINNKIFSKYFDGMTSLLSGNQFNDTYEGLSTAKGTINTKLQELEQKLTECEGNITYREGRKAYWQEQLRLATTEA